MHPRVRNNWLYHCSNRPRNGTSELLLYLLTLIVNLNGLQRPAESPSGIITYAVNPEHTFAMT